MPQVFSRLRRVSVPVGQTRKTYGSGAAYNTYYKNQLRELLTNYGDIFFVCGLTARAARALTVRSRNTIGTVTMLLSESFSRMRLSASADPMFAG